MSGIIRIIESNKHFTIDEKSCLSWIDSKNDSWWNEISSIDDKEYTREGMSVAIQEFNETHSIHNEGSAGPTPSQTILLEYISKVLKYKIYSFEVNGNDIVAIISPGVHDSNLIWNYDGESIKV